MNLPVEITAPGAVAERDEVDLRDLWEAFSPWKWRVLLLSFLVASLAAVLAFNMQPLYPSSTTLLVEAAQAQAVKIEQVYDLESAGNEYFETQFAIVRSREIARRVVQSLGLTGDVFFYSEKPGLVGQVKSLVLPADAPPARSDEQKIEMATASLIEKLTVEPLRKTQLVSISIEHPDPLMAARITDAIATTYIENQMEVQLEITRSAAQWLGSRLSDLKQKLEEAERDLQKFLETNNLVNLQGVQTVPAEELRELNKRLAIASGNVTELSLRYGEQHPRLVSAREELATIDREYNGKLQQIQEISRKEARLRQLQRNVEVSRYLYDTFLQRVTETAETGKWEAPVARIVDPGVASVVPSKPRKGVIVVIAFIATFLFATMCVFVASVLDRGVKTPQQLRDIGVAPLGALPLLSRRLKAGENPYQDTITLQDHSFTEAVKTLRTNVILDDVLQRRTTLAVVSTVPGEGKTTVTLCLARSLSELEKVLVIDADLRRPSVHRALGLPSGGAGLAQLVARVNTFEECLVQISENLHVLPAGAIPPNPSDLLSSARFSAVLADLKARGYERIVIDTAPVGAVSDALVVGSQVDGVICVVHADRTGTEMVADSVRRLREKGSTVIGAVLNQVGADLLHSHQYHYHGYYGRYEGYNTPDGKA
jgi:succinoglycan biosynthesis transport protein ExoP